VEREVEPSVGVKREVEPAIGVKREVEQLSVQVLFVLDILVLIHGG